MRLKLSFRAVVTACAVAITVVAPRADAQSHQPRFEVASVKRLPPDARFGINRGGPGTSDPGRITWTLGLSALIVRAYGAREDQLVAPAWVTNGNRYKYSIAATMPPDTSKEQFRLMLQNLLTERFHLMLHHDTKKFPGYELVVAPGGPKFKQIPDNDEVVSATVPANTGRLEPDENGFPKLGPGLRHLVISPKLGTWGTYRGRFRESIEDFLAGVPFFINESAGAPVGSPFPRVIDKTGLSGRYEFTLEFSGGTFFGNDAPLLARREPEKVGDSPTVPLASEPPRRGGGITIFAAFEKQLGLELKKTRDVDVDILVVDSVNKDPDEN